MSNIILNLTLTPKQDYKQIRNVYVYGKSLSKREKTIILLLSQGRSRQEIATELYLSINTIKNHLGSICDKLNVNTSMQAALAVAYNEIPSHMLD